MRRKFSVIIGCSGVTSISPSDIPYFENNALLISMSSGTHEMDLDGFLKEATKGRIQLINRDVIHFKEAIHSNLNFDWVSESTHNHFTIVNGGMPITFDGNMASIPGPMIQQTRTMMLAASVQASSLLHSGNLKLGGIAELNTSFQDWLITEFNIIEKAF